MSFRLRNSNSRMARTILIDCEGLESEKKKHARPLEIHEVWGCTIPWRWRLFSHSPVGRKKMFSKLVCTCMAIKLQPRTLRRNVVRGHRKVGRGPRGGRFTFRKSEHQARHSQFAHWLSRWPAGLVRDRSGPSSIRRERSNKTKLPKAWSCWAKMQVSVGLWVGMYGHFSLSTNRKARELC